MKKEALIALVFAALSAAPGRTLTNRDDGLAYCDGGDGCLDCEDGAWLCLNAPETQLTLNPNGAISISHAADGKFGAVSLVVPGEWLLAAKMPGVVFTKTDFEAKMRREEAEGIDFDFTKVANEDHDGFRPCVLAGDAGNGNDHVEVAEWLAEFSPTAAEALRGALATSECIFDWDMAYVLKPLREAGLAAKVIHRGGDYDRYCRIVGVLGFSAENAMNEA